MKDVNTVTITVEEYNRLLNRSLKYDILSESVNKVVILIKGE